MDETHFEPTSDWKRRLRQRLIEWYQANRRDLPWRRKRDPYEIWISEIMLQQTQVETVKPYFKAFIKRFPTVKHLAKGAEQDVLRLWEGLGYYRRARQLHQAAQMIVKEHRGVFPRDFEEVLALPGIGRYTAGAILSIAHDDRHPILEANTLRVYSRWLAYEQNPRSTSGQRDLWKFAEEILPNKKVGEFNQAAMELGSDICSPKAPRCLICPVRSCCQTFAHGLQDQIPKPHKQKTYEEVTDVAVVVFRRGAVLLRQCREGELWEGLWDFPRFRIDQAHSKYPPIVEEVKRLSGVVVQPEDKFATIKHGVTKYRITLECFRAEFESGRVLKKNGLRWVKPQELDELPLSSTGRKIGKMIQKP